MDHKFSNSGKGSQSNLQKQRHQDLEADPHVWGGESSSATNYPPKLVYAIARGVRAQHVLDGQKKR